MFFVCLLIGYWVRHPVSRFVHLHRRLGFRFSHSIFGARGRQRLMIWHARDILSIFESGLTGTWPRHCALCRDAEPQQQKLDNTLIQIPDAGNSKKPKPVKGAYRSPHATMSQAEAPPTVHPTLQPCARRGTQKIPAQWHHAHPHLRPDRNWPLPTTRDNVPMRIAVRRICLPAPHMFGVWFIGE